MYQKQIPSKNIPIKIGDTNIKPYWQVIEKIIEESDVLLEVIDARMPELSRNFEIEELVKKHNKKLIIILNKADLVSENILRKRLKKFKAQTPSFIVSSNKKIGTKRLRNYLIAMAKKNKKLRIGVLGYPNTGKSSVINALAQRRKAKVTSRAGTTHGEQWVNIRNSISIVDSPGVIPLKENDEVRYALIGSRNVEKIKNTDEVAYTIIELFEDKKPVEKLYNIKLKKNLDSEKIIKEIGMAKNFLKKGGEIDEKRTEIQIIRDWQTGKLRL